MIYAADFILPITSSPIKNGAVFVKEGHIMAIGEASSLTASYPDEEVHNFKKSILMPGLVNLHSHLECSSFGFLAKPAPFSDWLKEMIKAGYAMGKDDWLQAARQGIKKSLAAGMTCIADITRTGAGLHAITEINMPALAYLEVVAVDDKNLLDAVADLLEKVKGFWAITTTSELKLGISPHSPYSLSSSALNALSEISSEYELPITIHLAESKAEVDLISKGDGQLADLVQGRLDLDVIKQGGSGKSPAFFLDSFGLIRNSLIAAHGVWLNENDIELLKRRGSSVVLCPTSNELLRVGEAPVAKFIQQGLKVGIGTDSLASNPEYDLFAEIRKVRSIFSKQSAMEKSALKEDEVDLSSKRLIEMITIDAATILGFSDRLGSIEPGKRADLVVIDFSSTSFTNPYDFLVESASKSMISHTILGGEIVYYR
ncbi:MAG: amidohydrolase family protein [Actinomycetota bacterium]|nr:amidohydrolase family protein [Actinomycetota bacterium]